MKDSFDEHHGTASVSGGGGLSERMARAADRGRAQDSFLREMGFDPSMNTVQVRDLYRQTHMGGGVPSPGVVFEPKV